MASKELTYFLVDVSPPMGRRCAPRDHTDLEHALSYVKAHCSDIVVRNRKADRVGFVLFDASVSPLERVTILFDDSMLTYDQLKQAVSQMRPSAETTLLSPSLPDLYAAALTAVRCFGAKRKLQYDRNLVIISNLETEAPSLQDVAGGNSELAGIAREFNVKVVLSVVDMNGASRSLLKDSNIHHWLLALAGCPDAEMHDTRDMDRAMTYSPCLKKIASHPIFSGKLRFGASLDQLAPSLKSEHDDQPHLWLSTTVHTFPACRHVAAHLTHSYFGGNESLVRAKRKTNYYTRSFHTSDDSRLTNIRMDWYEEDHNPTGTGFDKVYVDKSSCVPGFRYSHEDVVALTRDLAETARLKTASGIDIMGLLERDKIPHALCVQDSQYVVPIANALAADKLSFNLLAHSMLNLKCVAIVRFVPSDNADIQAAVLSPVEFAIGSRLALGFTLTPLAFKEDESLGRFVSLTEAGPVSGDVQNPASNEADSDADEHDPHDLDGGMPDYTPRPAPSRTLPTKNANDLMDAFVLSKSLDSVSDQTRPPLLMSNQKVALGHTLHLRLPSKAPFDPPTNLIPSSPATYKFSNNLTKIVSYSLSQNSIALVLDDPTLVETVLVNKDSTNLYNLSNVLLYSTNAKTESWLKAINQKSMGVTKKLAQELQCKYHTTSADAKKRKTEASSHGEEDTGKAPFDSFFDINLIV